MKMNGKYANNKLIGWRGDPHTFLYTPATWFHFRVDLLVIYCYIRSFIYLFIYYTHVGWGDRHSPRGKMAWPSSRYAAHMNLKIMINQTKKNSKIHSDDIKQIRTSRMYSRKYEREFDGA